MPSEQDIGKGSINEFSTGKQRRQTDQALFKWVNLPPVDMKSERRSYGKKKKSTIDRLGDNKGLMFNDL